jgi:membrane fusion protein (multidrug efflux system)
MNLRNRFIPGIVAMAASVVTYSSCEKKEAPVKAGPPEVLVTTAGVRDVPVYREWVGTLDGTENAEIRARVTGYLLRRAYQEGSLVKKGQLLFEIDSRPFEAALAEAKSQLQQGMATQLATQADADRNKQLYEKKVISTEEYTNKTQLNEASVAKVAALKANVDQAKLNLEFCMITSPVDGIAGVAQAQVGDLVGTATSTVLTQVSTVDPIKILFPVSETEYLDASQRVQETLAKPFDQRPESIALVLADGSIFPHKGRLLSVDRQVKAATGTILVTATVPNPGSVLRPGFFARARILTEMIKGAVVVPQRAVSEVQGSYQLGIIDPDGKAEIRPVKVGPRDGQDWVISSGLKPGEKVVVEGLQKIKAGEAVVAKPWTSPGEKTAAAGEKTADEEEAK